MKRHNLDPISLLAGGFFLTVGIAIGNALSPLRVVRGLIDASRWAWPILVIVVGMALLIPAFKRQPVAETPQEDLTEALEELPPPID